MTEYLLPAPTFHLLNTSVIHFPFPVALITKYKLPSFFLTNCYLLDQLKLKKFLLECSSFLYIDSSFWLILFSFLSEEFNISGKAGLLAINSHLSEKVCFHFWKNLSGYRILDFFSFFNPLNVSLCHLLSSMVSEEKSDIIFVLVSLYLRFLFSLLPTYMSFRFFFFFFKHNIVFIHLCQMVHERENVLHWGLDMTQSFCFQFSILSWSWVLTHPTYFKSLRPGFKH